MEEGSEWYQSVSRDIARCAAQLGDKKSRRYKLGLLLRIAGRVDAFAASCSVINSYKPELSQLAASSCNLPAAPDKERRSYFATINKVVRHLHEDHEMVMPGHYIRIWPGMGATFGIAIGSTGGNLGVGIGLLSGAIIGTGVGLFMDNRARKNDKVI